MRELSVIHGHILTAWALAGLFAPLFIAWLREVTHSYTQVLYVFVIFYFVALAVAVYMRYNYKLRLESNNAKAE